LAVLTFDIRCGAEGDVGGDVRVVVVSRRELPSQSGCQYWLNPVE
jgi:hypothetical protein